MSHDALYGNATDQFPEAVAANATAGEAIYLVTPPQGPDVAEVWCGVVRFIQLRYDMGH